MAKLPDRFKTKVVADLEYGVQKFCVPWTMFRGPEDELYLDGDSSFDDEPFGTSAMGVVKNKDGIVVDISGCDHIWPESPDGRMDETSIKVDVLIW